MNMSKEKGKTEVLRPGEKPESGALTKPEGQTLPAKSGPSGKGFENLETDDILLPRIKLLQALSPEVEDGLGKPGDIFLNLSNKVLGQKILITPILHFRSRIKWIDKEDGGGIDCSAPNARTPKEPKYAAQCGVCSLKEWDNTPGIKSKDAQPKCTLYENFLVLIGDELVPVILPMERTKAKIAKKAYSMMAVKGGNMFDNVYELGVSKEKNDKDEPYFNYVFRDVAQRTDEARRLACDRFWQFLVDKDLTKNMEHPEADAAAGAPAGEGKY